MEVKEMITTNEEINNAIKEVEFAQNEFDYADKEFQDVAIMKLSYAMKRLDVLIRLAKVGHVIKEI